MKGSLRFLQERRGALGPGVSRDAVMPGEQERLARREVQWEAEPRQPGRPLAGDTACIGPCQAGTACGGGSLVRRSEAAPPLTPVAPGRHPLTHPEP